MILMTLGDPDESDELDEMLCLWQTHISKQNVNEEHCSAWAESAIWSTSTRFSFYSNLIQWADLRLADFTRRQTSAFACLHFYISSPPDDGYLGQSDDVAWVSHGWQKKWEKTDRNCHRHACEADLDWSSMNCKLWWDSHILPTFISAAGAGLPGYNSHNVASENGVDSYIPEAVDGIEYILCQ